MALQISYDPGSGVVLLDCGNRGPVNFLAVDAARGTDNLSSSGQRERVLEAVDVLVSWTMPALQVDDDYAAWATFYRWALSGTGFTLLPNQGVSSRSYTVVLEQMEFTPKRVSVRRYSLDVKLRCIPGTDAPADAGEVMLAFWGLA